MKNDNELNKLSKIFDDDIDRRNAKNSLYTVIVFIILMILFEIIIVLF